MLGDAASFNLLSAVRRTLRAQRSTCYNASERTAVVTCVLLLLQQQRPGYLCYAEWILMVSTKPTYRWDRGRTRAVNIRLLNSWLTSVAILPVGTRRNSWEMERVCAPASSVDYVRTPFKEDFK